jgi:hypothetical protein
MKEQAFQHTPERITFEEPVLRGEILPPLPKPAGMRDAVQAQERIKVIRSELTHYIREQSPLQVIIVENKKPEPETIWEEIGEAIVDGVAGVRDFIAEVKGIVRQGRTRPV